MRDADSFRSDILNSIIETQSLCCDYNGEPALKNVSISIPKGKMTFVLGGNGAGKSTLFLALNGIIKPSGGRVLFNGEPLKYDKQSLRKARERIALVFQNPDDQLFCASVYEDISFGAVNMGLDEKEVRRRVDEAMEITGVTAFKDKSVHALSCGQKKRAAIAGVLVMEPEVMILDEPTAGLDPEGTGEIMSALRKIKNEKDLTIIISTHDMDMAPVYAEWVYLLDRGEVAAGGEAEKFFASPEILRAHKLRLPRVSHLLEILNKHDGISVSSGAATISAARNELLGHIRR